MRRIVPLLVLCLAATLRPAPAQQGPGDQRHAERDNRRADRDALREARRFRSTQVDGATVETRVRQLAQLPWYSSLAKAQRAARRQDKLVLWIHALGRIDGFL